ncbi:MAG: hypothetical protein ACLRMJ_11100 [Alistipes finegoldii]
MANLLGLAYEGGIGLQRRDARGDEVGADGVGSREPARQRPYGKDIALPENTLVMMVCTAGSTSCRREDGLSWVTSCWLFRTAARLASTYGTWASTT